MSQNDRYLSVLHPIDLGLRKERQAVETARQQLYAYQQDLVARCTHDVVFETNHGRWQQCAHCGAECDNGERIGDLPYVNLRHRKGTVYLAVDGTLLRERRNMR